MKRLTALAGTLLLCVAGFAQPKTTVTWKTEVQQKNDSLYTIVFTGQIADGFHTYGSIIDGGYPAGVIFSEENAAGYTPGEMHDLGEKQEYEGMMVYFDEIVLAQDVIAKDKNVKVKGELTWQSCNETSCFMPEYLEFEADLSKAATASDQGTIKSSAPAKGFNWAIVIEAILWGFAALLTPCVFPMVPMTVSFFMKGSSTPAAGRFKASMYGLFIVLLYTVPISLIILITRIVGGDAVTADIFNWLATHWLPNIIFFIVFMLFAASFFGAFEIVLPSKLVNKSDKGADKGGLIGTFFMALTLVLVSFSCTGPIVGSVLIKATQGEFWEPMIAMLAFSLAFALPFTILAFFPSLLKNIPKSGGWLNSVKVVLGFVEVALGFKFLSVADQTYHWGLLDREVYLAIWIVVFTLLGLYLAKLREELDQNTERRLVSALMDIPGKQAAMLDREKEIETLARNFADARGFFFIGRGIAYPPALEGALKLKEISYLHAEAYPAGEMKHGPIALLDKELPVVALVPKNDLWEKTISNIEESMARKSPIIALATEGDTEIGHYTQNVIFTPETEPELFPFVAVVPLQLFAYYIARQRGCDIDMPRNLAKSVTVE